MKLNTTPQNQISPVSSVNIRTDTLRHCLADLRTHGRAIAQAMGATGHRSVTLDDGTELNLTQQSAGDGAGRWHPETCDCVRYDSQYRIVARYAIYPR